MTDDLTHFNVLAKIVLFVCLFVFFLLFFLMPRRRLAKRVNKIQLNASVPLDCNFRAANMHPTLLPLRSFIN